jgi:lipid II:glycine glycyltransferase (peptidoglycan interpeptide bridge formation enzyme)
MGQVKILTGPYSQAEWNSAVEEFSDVSLLQTWEYAEASSSTRGLEVGRLLFEADGRIVGAAQGFTRALPFVGGGAVVFNRGPIWQRKTASAPGLAAILAELRDYWVRKKGMYLRISPAIQVGQVSEALFREAGYELAGQSHPWISARLDLSLPVETLRGSLRSNWASSLKKAEASGVAVEDGSDERSFLQIRQALEELLRVKDFESTVTPDFLKKFQELADGRHKFWSLTAALNGRSFGGIAIARYGHVCEYLVGAVNDEGKRFNIGQLLLWSAVLRAKDQGYRWFDLGGMDPEGTPKGVLYFKQGLKAEPYAYIGDFEAYSPGLINKTIRWKLERALRIISRAE